MVLRAMLLPPSYDGPTEARLLESYLQMFKVGSLSPTRVVPPNRPSSRSAVAPTPELPWPELPNCRPTSSGIGAATTPSLRALLPAHDLADPDGCERRRALLHHVVHEPVLHLGGARRTQHGVQLVPLERPRAADQESQ